MVSVKDGKYFDSRSGCRLFYRALHVTARGTPDLGMSFGHAPNLAHPRIIFSVCADMFRFND